MNLVTLRILKQVWFSFAVKKASDVIASVMVLKTPGYGSTNAVLVLDM